MQRTARLTGLAYLGLALSGLLGFLLIRPHLYTPGNPAATATNLAAHPTLARLGVAADLAVVLTQALAAVGFHRLFHRTGATAAAWIAAFGLANAVLVLIATAFSATAPGSSDPHLLFDLNARTWQLGGIFFGLWLIPMGWLTRRCGFLHPALGRTLTVAGLCYLTSTFFPYVVSTSPVVPSALTIPATAAELWMIVALLTLRRTGEHSPLSTANA